MIGFFFGVYVGGVVVWIWAMCREADEDEAIRRQFDDGLSQSMRRATATSVTVAIHRAQRRLGQHLAVDAARARRGLGPCTFYSRESRRVDDNPETFI